MFKQRWLILLVVIFCFSGCTVAGEPDDEDVPLPLPPEEPTTEGDVEVTFTPESSDSAPSQPAIVNLGDLPADGGRDSEGELQVMPAPGNPTTGRLPQDVARLLALLQGDVAERLTVRMEDVALDNYEVVTWSDASLGCPRPDELYAQMLVEGYKFVLMVDNETFVYHTDGADRFVLCVDGSPSK